MVRGLAFPILLLLATIPAATAQVPSLDALADPLAAQPVADAALLQGASEFVAADSASEPSAAAFQGVCVRAAAWGTSSDRDAGAPVAVDDPEEDDHTGVEWDGTTQDGMGASVCVVPCSPVSAAPPEIRYGCIDEWAWYVCGSTCLTASQQAQRLICPECVGTA